MATGANTAEVYGFVGYLTSIVAYGIYLLWAFLPEEALHWCGVTYYPSKEWAIIIPTWLCVALVFGFWVYESLNMMSIPPKQSLTTIRDEHSKLPPGSPPQCFPGFIGGVPPLFDIPAAEVSRRLYGSPVQ